MEPTNAPVVSDKDAIVVSAVVFRDVDGQVMTVRKGGTTRFMLPGGKPARGEGALQTAVREIFEELEVEIDHGNLELLGVYRTQAANESDRTIIATVFTHPYIDVIDTADPSGEIDEIRWITLDEDGDDIAPLLREAVLPVLRGEVDQTATA